MTSRVKRNCQHVSTFWPSSANKTNLQLLARHWLIENRCEWMSHKEIIVSGTGFGDTNVQPCLTVNANIVPTQIHALNFRIEEADLRMMPHFKHVARNAYK